MLTIRMQRLGRKGHPTYRVVVQDVRQTPTSGKYVALLGSYDPHTKANTLAKDKAEFYLKNGAQPSDRVVRLFADQGITLPTWVKQPAKHAREIRNADKLRKNRPASEEPAEKPEEPAAEEPAKEEVSEAEGPAEEPAPGEDISPEAAAEKAAAEKTEE